MKEFDVLTIMREHTTKTKFYMLISRNAFCGGKDGFVDVSIQLPALLKKLKLMFYLKENYEKQADDKFLVGNKAQVIEEFELRKYCDIFYEYSFFEKIYFNKKIVKSTKNTHYTSRSCLLQPRF